MEIVMEYTSLKHRVRERAISLSKHRRFRTAGAVALASIALVAVTEFVPASAASPGAAIDLSIRQFAFAPKEITVAPGTKIVWINHDESPHTVVSNDRSFVSKGLDTDDRFEHTFEREGDFGYICSVHPFMTGVVHVRKQ
jgi:plastocyanin